MQREQREVHNALGQIGFMEFGPFDYVYSRNDVTCGLPKEETKTFESAIKFLKEGAFQDTLKKPTRILYYNLSEILIQYQQKGSNERPIQQQRFS